MTLFNRWPHDRGDNYLDARRAAHQDAALNNDKTTQPIAKQRKTLSMVPKNKQSVKKKTHGGPIISPDAWKRFQKQAQNKPPQIRYSSDEFQHYLTNGRPPKANSTPVENELKKAKIEVKGPVLPNAHLFAQKLTGELLSIESNGIKTNLLENESDAIDAADICMGLDFGTSSVKVVVCDANRKVHYAIPFFEIGAENPYIFPSHVYLKRGEYRLGLRQTDSDAACIRDMKITLMEKEGENSEYMAHATAFLALIIRHARGWLFATHGDVYRNSEINWSVNLGLPAEKSENTSLEKRFRLVALASANLAGHKGKVTAKNAEKYLRLATLSLRSGDISPDEMSVHPDMVAVYRRWCTIRHYLCDTDLRSRFSA